MSYTIKNRINKAVLFQGIVIDSHKSVVVEAISDWKELNRLSNSGKVLYSRVSTIPVKTATGQHLDTVTKRKKSKQVQLVSENKNDANLEIVKQKPIVEGEMTDATD